MLLYTLFVSLLFPRFPPSRTLQFVILKPITAVLSLIFMFIPYATTTAAATASSGGNSTAVTPAATAAVHHDPNAGTLYATDGWQITLLVAYNISYTLALYFLLLFYFAAKELLTGFHAVGKFGELIAYW